MTRAECAEGISPKVLSSLGTRGCCLWPGLALLVLLAAGWAPSRASAYTGANGRDEAYQAGMILVQQRHYQEAIQVFERGLRAQPADPMLLNAEGAVYSLEGDSKNAEAFFLRALNANPGFVSARKNLGIEYFRTGKYDLACPQFVKLAADPTSKPIAELFLGMIAVKQQRYERGAAMLEGAGELALQYSQSILALARALEELRKPQDSQAVLRHLDNSADVSAPDYREAAQLYSKYGQRERALQNLDRARRLDPDLPGIDIQRALLLAQMGRRDEALDALRELTSRKPDGDSLRLLAHIAEDAGDLRLALDSLRKAAKLDPQREESYLDFSTLCLDSGNFPLALEAADVGLANIPHSYRLMVQKGAVLDKMGNRKEAAQVLRSALTLQKDNSEAMVSLAITQTHDHRLQDAFSTLESGLKIFPGNYYMHYYLGNILVQMGEGQGGLDPAMTAKAERALHRAIQLNPTFADSYFQLGKLYLNTKQDLAEEYLVRCLKIDPKHGPAEYALGRLYFKMGKREKGQKLLADYVSLQQAEKLKEQRTPRVEASQH